MSSGAVGKFRSSLSDRNSISKTSGIPRLSMGHGIKKRNVHASAGKSTSKLPHQRNFTSNKSSKLDQKNQQKEMRQGKVFKQNKIERKVLSNLSNSPIVANRAVKSKVQTSAFEEQSGPDFKFETDASSLASILNNQPIQVSQLIEQRASSMAGDMLFYPDGRPSLCRRVPIVTNNAANGRPSMTAPGRVLSNKKATKPTCKKPQHSFLHSNAVKSRHSLYSVVQGRYSNAAENKNKIQIGRQSLQQGRKAASNKIVNDLKPLPFKSPPPQRILSRKNEVRISASPALRIPCVVESTPPAQRILRKNRKPLIRWADETDQVVQKKLEEFYTSPSTPNMKCKMEFTKTPVSILKSRKHTKRTSLTPPMVKKDKKVEIAEDDCTIEIVSPHLLNNFIPEKQDEKSPEVPKIVIQDEKVTSPVQPVIHPTSNPKISQQKQETAQPKSTSPSAQAVTKEKVEQATQQKVVDDVLSIMTQQMSKVKRRSVQAEILNLYQQVALQFKAPEAILEESEEVDDEERAKDVEVQNNAPMHNSTPMGKDDTGAQKSPIDQINSLLTPENMNKLQQSYEETNKSLDDLALRTEEINRELHQLQLDKERLKALRKQANFTKTRYQSLATPASNTGASPDLKTASSFDDVIGLGKLVKADLDQGSLEFKNNGESPILSARIEFATKTSPRDAGRSPLCKGGEFYTERSEPETRVVLDADAGATTEVANRRDLLMKEVDDSAQVLLSAFDDGKGNISSKERSPKIPQDRETSRQKHNSDTISSPIASLPSDSSPINKENKPAATTGTNSKLLHKDAAASVARFGQNLEKTKTDATAQVTASQTPEVAHRGDKLVAETARDNNIDVPIHGPTNSFADVAKPTCAAKEKDATTLGEKGQHPICSNFTSGNRIGHVTGGYNGVGSVGTNYGQGLCETLLGRQQKQEKSSLLSPKPALFRGKSTEVKQVVGEKRANNARAKSESVLSDETSEFKAFLTPLSRPETLASRTLNPQPVRLPFQTPKAFRELRQQYANKGPTRYRESPKSKMKQQFTQALLDEEVALLTCRIVKPPCSVLHSKQINPVATSLHTGDDTHFVPIVQTPTSDKIKRLKGTHVGSAFSSYSSVQ